MVTGMLTGVPSDVAQSVALITTELASNSVRHAATSFVVTVEQLPDRIRIEVADDGEGEPVVMSPGPTATSGRGLHIVRALADSWGIIPRQGRPGKTIWVTVTLPATSGADQDAETVVASRSSSPPRSGPPGTASQVMSAFHPWRKRPRSRMPKKSAGSEVMRLTACSSVIASRSRTQLPSK